MNNSDLAESVAAENGLSKTDARKVVDGVFAAIAPMPRPKATRSR